MNYSKQREMILDAVYSYDGHPTAENIYRALKSHCPKLSLATVYRNLNKLCDNGNIKRLQVIDSPERYDKSVAPHYHLYCRKCRSVVDIPYAVDDWNKLLGSAQGHVIEACDVIFYGVCEQCANGENGR